MSTLTAAALGEDHWLAEQFGRPAFKLNAAALMDASLRERDSIRRTLDSQNAFAWAKVPVSALDELRVVESIGFRVVDTNVTFEGEMREMEPTGLGACVRVAAVADEPAVVALARRSFRNSRFHQDASIGIDVADRLKSEWARAFFRGSRGDVMFAADLDGTVAAFALALRASDGAAVIDLIAVDQAHRGRGIAGRLVVAAARSLRSTWLRAGTQLTNFGAIRCYGRLGLRASRTECVLHFHAMDGLAGGMSSCADRRR